MSLIKLLTSKAKAINILMLYKRGRSSAWLERWPVTPEVASSNLVGPAYYFCLKHAQFTPPGTIFSPANSTFPLGDQRIRHILLTNPIGQRNLFSKSIESGDLRRVINVVKWGFENAGDVICSPPLKFPRITCKSRAT